MKDIFEIMRSGEEVRQDHPQYNEFMDFVSSTLRKNITLNNSENVDEVRERLSEIIGSSIDKSTGIFVPFYINFGKHTTIGKMYLSIMLVHFWT
jgi:hypothetical protein